MEEDIQEALEKIYKIKIKVTWRDFRIYDIIGQIEHGKFEVGILYDTTLTIDGNLPSIINAVDNAIIKLYKKEN